MSKWAKTSSPRRRLWRARSPHPITRSSAFQHALHSLRRLSARGAASAPGGAPRWDVFPRPGGLKWLYRPVFGSDRPATVRAARAPWTRGWPCTVTGTGAERPVVDGGCPLVLGRSGQVGGRRWLTRNVTLCQAVARKGGGTVICGGGYWCSSCAEDWCSTNFQSLLQTSLRSSRTMYEFRLSFWGSGYQQLTPG